jgi:hypothetical protein
LRGEGRGEGLFFEFEQKHLENPVQILDDIVVPDADHAITEGAQVGVALLVFEVSRMLTAVELDNQMPLATNEVGVVPINGLLAYKFEAAELSTANAGPQSEFGGRERPPQRSRPLGALLILAPQLSSLPP